MVVDVKAVAATPGVEVGAVSSCKKHLPFTRLY